MNKKISLLAAFLVPFLIIIIICIDHEVYPFGEQCILQVDMYHQYCPFFTELMEKLKNGQSAFYSWNVGLGVDFVSLYAYYLASPLNWFLAFCPAEHVIEFMTILVVLKIALCGLTFACYLQAHFGLGNLSEKHGGVALLGTAIFGTAYALSAFMAAYAWNIMWTDCMVLAPLVILGLERLIKEGKPVLYYAALSLSILSNYYISIMVCMFLVLWFFLYWMENRESGIGAWLRFAGYSLLAGGTGAVLILPTAIMLGYSGSAGSSFPETMEWYFNLLAELSRHFMTTEIYTGDEHWPNIYCGVFVLVFLVLYLQNRQISWKGKAARLLLAVLFIVSFSNNFLDFMWHGFRFPTSLPGRQSFLYIFLLLVISFESFLKLQGNKLWHVLIALFVNAGFLLAAYHFSDSDMQDKMVFILSGVFIGCYLVLIGCYLAGNARVQRMMLGIGCLAVVAELTLNYDITGLDTVSRTSYMKHQSEYKMVLSQGEEQAKKEGLLFYRTEELERNTKNDAAFYGYRSATQFSSLMNLEVSHFYQNVGMEGGKNFYSYSGATPLLSAMLSVRYILADTDMEEGPLSSLVAESGETYLYENAYVLPLGFMMSEDVIADWDYENAGDIRAQNELAYLLGAAEQMLVPVSAVSGVGESSFEAEEDGYYYAVYEKTTISNLTEETSDGRNRSFSKVSHGYTLDLGYCKAGTTVKVTNTAEETLQMTVYRLNLDAVKTAWETLNRQTMTMTSFTDCRIEGNIKVEEAGRLIFSIADEEGWTLYVDGKETETEKFGKAFLSVHLEPGIHVIELHYETPGFFLGAGISGGCVLAFLLLMLFRHKTGRKNW